MFDFVTGALRNHLQLRSKPLNGPTRVQMRVSSTILSFDERLGLMVDRELTEREETRLTTRLQAARLRHNACLEDIDSAAHAAWTRP